MQRKRVRISTWMESAEKELKINLTIIVENARGYKISFVEQGSEASYVLSVDELFHVLSSLQEPAELHAVARGVPFLVKITLSKEGHFVDIIPVEPYELKKGVGAEKEDVDLSFYIERALELCEHFPIYELTAA